VVEDLCAPRTYPRYFTFCPTGKLGLETREDSKDASLAQNATALYTFSYPIQTAAIFRWIVEILLACRWKIMQDRQYTWYV